MGTKQLFNSKQRFCGNKHCISTVWEGSKYYKKHFLTWKPGLPGEEERKEIKSLFDKASLDQRHPETEAMAEILRRIESQPKIPASEVVNIDIEFTFFSQKVLQIGLADVEENKALDCFPRYSEGQALEDTGLPYPTMTDILVVLISPLRTGALCQSKFFYDRQ